MPQVFISHSSKDDHAVDRLAEALERAGISTWVDHRHGIEPGAANWDAAIRSAIVAADAGIFVLSQAALESQICAAECLLVRELDDPLYVLRLSAVTPESVWLYIKMIQYADCATDFDAGVHSLIRALKGETAADLPAPLRAKFSGRETLRRYLPYALINPMRGRESELADLGRRLGANSSAVQVTGTGGMGKSRLAAEAALNHPLGAVWHRCTTSSKPDDVLSLLADHLRLPPESQSATIFAALRARPALLVLDNAEDVPARSERRAAYLDLIASVLEAGAPIILTSRNVWDDLKPRSALTLTIPDDEQAALIAADFAAAEGIALSDEQARTLAAAARRYPRLIEWAVGQLHETDFERIMRQLRELKNDDLQDALDEMIGKTVRQMISQARGGAQAEALLRRLTVCEGSYDRAAALALKPDAIADEDALDNALALLCKWRFLRYDETLSRYTTEEVVRLALPAAAAAFAAYAEHYIAVAEQFRTLPPEGWRETVERDAANITAVGDALLAQFRPYMTIPPRPMESGPGGEVAPTTANTADAVGTGYIPSLPTPPNQGEALEAADRPLRFALNITRYLANRREVRRLEWLEMGLAAARLTGDQSRQALFLNELGLAWSALGEKRKVLDFYEQALPFDRAIGNRGGEAITLNNIGTAWSALGEKRKALDFFEQALPLHIAVGDRGGEAITLHNIGLAWSDLGEKHKALDFLEQALHIHREIGNSTMEATTLSNVGVAWSALGEKRKALDFFEQALPLRRAVGDRGGEATTLASIGLAWSDLGEKHKALDFFERALELVRMVGDRRGEATTLNNIGAVWDDLGEKRKALDFYEQALPMHREVGNRTMEATTLNNIGSAWDDLGETRKALEFYEQALPLYRAVGDRGGEATTLNNMAWIYYDDGEQQRAADIFRQIIPIMAEVGAVTEEATIIRNLAFVLGRALGQRDEAITLVERALALLEGKGLDRDASGGTVEQYRAYLAELRG